jgi:hypothetical protein
VVVLLRKVTDNARFGPVAPRGDHIFGFSEPRPQRSRR